MDEQGTKVSQFDSWLVDESPAAACVVRQWLEPAEGKDAVIFPPTYAPPEGSKAEDWTGYNIDRFADGSSICQIDSIGSQANRMEPIFKKDPYRRLVPRVIIKAGNREIDLLDAGHRAADAVVRFSMLGPRLHEAFTALKDGDAEPLARIAPTSIVFGSWDSRATQVKIPRIVRSVIRAYDVKVLHRSAQYTTIAGDILEAGDAEVTTKGPKAELGLAHVPAVRTHGGVQVLGEIRRDASLNLAALRTLKSCKEDTTMALRRYILGLCLICFTAPQETNLREGCQLVPATQPPPRCELVKHDGSREPLQIGLEMALEFAQTAAVAFGVAADIGSFDFYPGLVRDVMSLKEDALKQLLKQGPVTPEAVARVAKKGKVAG